MSVVGLFLCLLFFTGADSYRLSRDVIPKHYSLKIRPDFDKEIFVGEVSIYINTLTNMEKIILHSSQLNITETYLNQRKAINQEESDERISVRYADTIIQPGEHTLRFKFEGQLREQVYGFIKAPFEFQGQETYVYVTDLEPTNARKVFPCFDEPYFKAKFNIRLISPDPKYVAISNMPEINKFSTTQGTVYDFETSVVMSTYLVSFTFTYYSRYEDYCDTNGKKIPINIYTLNANGKDNKYPMSFAKKALQYYTEFTDIPYPLSKLDMIEYERTESAATENWGLITFRKGLLTPKFGEYHNSQIELVVYHELSHFWFGNLVTNDWWDDLWLQEGFATYMSYKLSAKENNVSQVKNMKDFQIGRYLETETEKPGTAVVSYISTPDSILTKFNNIVYDKAANLLLILEQVIGEDIFKESIRKYLKKYAYKTVTTNDFIATIEEIVPNITIRSFMESYLYQEGFPLITVDEKPKGTYVLKQFVARKPINDIQSFERGYWTIPLTFKTDVNNKSETIWFDKDRESLEIKVPNAKWFVLNTGGLEMYKVKLSEELWKRLIDNFNDLDKETAHQIVSDAYYLFQFNIANCDILIKLMQAVKNKDAWSNFSLVYFNIHSCFQCEKYTEELHMFGDFIKKRFAETNRTDTISLNVDCNIENESDKIDKNSLEKCTSWIRNNIGGSEDNTVKIM